MEPNTPVTGDDSQESGPKDLITNAAEDWITDSISGIPAPIRKNALKAFGQLCTAAIQVPVAILEGMAMERRAETVARLKFIEKTSAQVCERINVDIAYAELASEKYAQRVVREQRNVDKIAKIAISALQSGSGECELFGEDELNEDWINNFEREAREKSSDEMQLLFGRILAGEIKSPNTFSLATVRLIGQLDARVAELFVKFCSLSVSIGFENTVVDSRIIAIEKPAGANGLREQGLGYFNIVMLQEYGLVSAALDSHASYETCVIYNDQAPAIPFKYSGKNWGLKKTFATDSTPVEVVRGVALTKVGRELAQIVDIEPDAGYTELLMGKFAALGFEMIVV